VEAVVGNAVHPLSCARMFASSTGQRAASVIVDMVRREVEEADALDGIFVPMSLAGGTGSGVGAALTEALRDAFPEATLINQVPWKLHYQSGVVGCSLVIASHATDCLAL
jgi:hypothetical protein